MTHPIHSASSAVAWNRPQQCIVTGVALEAIALLVTGSLLVGFQISPVGATVTLSLGFLSGLLAYALITTQRSQRDDLEMLAAAPPHIAPPAQDELEDLADKVVFTEQETFDGDESRAFAVRFEGEEFATFFLKQGEKEIREVYKYNKELVLTVRESEDEVPFNLQKILSVLISMKPSEYLVAWSEKKGVSLLVTSDENRNISIAYYGPLTESNRYSDALNTLIEGLKRQVYTSTADRLKSQQN